MPYAILRVSKLTNLGVATTATQHNYRLQDTPNANPQLAAANVEYLNHEHQNYWHLASERIHELHLPRLREDAVRAVELVLTASPDFFARDTAHRAHDVRESAWVRDNLAFVQQRFGKENVVGFSLHQDEITPHIHCVVVPVTADGRLSCRDMFSPASLRQLQTDYAEAMKPHGLARGIHYSTAHHEDVRRHYGAQQTSKEALRELAQPLQKQCHQIRARADGHDDMTYRCIEGIRLADSWGELLAAANHKITKLATIATAHALAHERAVVLERQLANSQKLLTQKHTELTTTKTDLTKQLHEAKQLAEQQSTRADQQVLLHKQAVIRHSQGQPLPAYYGPQVQKLRQRHQDTIEQALATRLRTPLYSTEELGPALAQVGKGYEVRVTGPHEFTVTSKHDGTRLSSTELRPNDRDLAEQLRQSLQRTQERGPTGGIEM